MTPPPLAAPLPPSRSLPRPSALFRGKTHVASIFAVRPSACLSAAAVLGVGSLPCRRVRFLVSSPLLLGPRAIRVLGSDALSARLSRPPDRVPYGGDGSSPERQLARSEGPHAQGQ